MHLLKGNALKENLEATILSDVASGKVGGAAIAVTQDGKTVYQGCFGDERIGIRVTEHTLFRLASMTKPITAAAILLLIDRGAFELDTPVSKFIPGFEKMDIGEICGGEMRIKCPARTSITIRHLLTHSSGLGSGPVGDYVAAELPPCKRETLAQAVEHYVKNPLDFEPFTCQSYSPIHAFDVLARIVEIVSGLSYDKFLEKEIFLPLGMVETTFAPTAEQWSCIVPMHTYQNGAGRVVAMPENSVALDFPITCFSGAGSLLSTLEDYKKFAAMLLNYGTFEGKRIISEKMIREMATAQLPSSIMSGPEVWGLGVRVINDETYGALPCGTFGWSGAYGTHFWVDPVNRITAVYMKNSTYDGGAGSNTACRFERDVRAALDM